MEVTVVPGGAVLGKSRTVFLDADLIDCDGWNVFILAESADGRNLDAVCAVGILLFHGIVSGLGRNFIVREPIFRVADGVFCSGAFGSNQLDRGTDAKPASGVGQHIIGADAVRALEPRINFPMGIAPDTGEGTGFVEPGSAQPV